MGIVRFAKEVAMLLMQKRGRLYNNSNNSDWTKGSRDYTVLDIRKALKLRGEELEKKLKEF
jgi:hypothetical protein